MQLERTNTSPSSPSMRHSLCTGAAMQYSTSCDSLLVSPVSPRQLPASNGHAMLHLERFTFGEEACLPWKHCDGFVEDKLYRYEISQSTNERNESFQPTLEEFDLLGGQTISHPPMEILNVNVVIQVKWAVHHSSRSLNISARNLLTFYTQILPSRNLN
jgi:hypothetical protein